MCRKKQELAAHLREALGIAVADARYKYATAIEDSCAAAFGAALRGLIRREEDTLISLLPIGTEEAYRKRRFSCISIAMVGHHQRNRPCARRALWRIAVFLNIASKNAAAQNTRLKTAEAQNSKTEEFKQEAIRFNGIVSAAAHAQDTIIAFSPVIEKTLPALRHDGITVTAITIASSGTDLHVSAVASTRDSAIAFRKSLEGNPLF